MRRISYERPVTMQFSGFIEASNDAKSADHVFDLLCKETASLGYGKIGFFALENGTSQKPAAPLDQGNSGPILISNFPEDFVRAYTEQRRHEVDPVLAMVPNTLTPLVWDEVVGRMTLSEEQKLLCRERLDAGIHDEICCPVHGPGGQTFALRFALEEPGPCDRNHLSALQVLAIHFYYAYSKHPQKSHEPNEPVVAPQGVDAPNGMDDSERIALPEACVLSPREQECMLWTARGKSASSISVILGLSENTVNFYVKNAMKKLGTTNRVIAVVLAVRAGLIEP